MILNIFKEQTTLRSFIASITLHLLLLAFLVFSVSTAITPSSSVSSKSKGEIVQAAIVDEQKVAEEVKKIQFEEMQQKQAEEQKQKALVQKLEQIKKEKIEEQIKLEKLKKDLMQAKQAEEANLAQIKLAKEKERKELEALKNEKEKKKTEMEALDDERQAEQERVKQMRVEREREEKRKENLAKQQAETKRKGEEAKKGAALKAQKDAEEASAANQRRIQSELERIAGVWEAKIKSNKRVMSSAPADLMCWVKITVLPDGNVIPELSRSSGNVAFDNEMIKAILKSQPFELPEDPEVKEELRTGVEFMFDNKEGEGV